MPGPPTPTSEQAQFILKPIVADFLRLWRGICIETHDFQPKVCLYSLRLLALHELIATLKGRVVGVAPVILLVAGPRTGRRRRVRVRTVRTVRVGSVRAARAAVAACAAAVRGGGCAGGARWGLGWRLCCSPCECRRRCAGCIGPRTGSRDLPWLGQEHDHADGDGNGDEGTEGGGGGEGRLGRRSRVSRESGRAWEGVVGTWKSGRGFSRSEARQMEMAMARWAMEISKSTYFYHTQLM